MDQAYWNEPIPFKQAYPVNGTLYFSEIMIIFLAYLMMMIAFLSWLGATHFDRFLPNQPWMLALLFSGPGLLSLFLLWLAQWTHNYLHKKAWRQAFMANNADLNLNYDAIDKCIPLMKGNKTHKVTFQVFVEQLAMHLREPNPLDIDQHSALSWDIIQLYCSLRYTTD